MKKTTPEQARARTARLKARREHQHRNCEMITRPQGPHWGLYCAQHGTWMQWLPASVAREIA